jgi:hypothetical protein
LKKFDNGNRYIYAKPAYDCEQLGWDIAMEIGVKDN